MEPVELFISDAVAVLERTPATISALLKELPETWAHATEGDGTWSPYDVVGHLIHGERTDWIPRLKHILAGEARPFPPFDRTAQFIESQGKSLEDSLTIFSDLRQRNVADLLDMHLAAQDLARTGRHPELGIVTLRQLLATWVVHDLDHVAQIVRTMAKIYADEVGPWQVYLSILRDREGQ